MLPLACSPNLSLFSTSSTSISVGGDGDGAMDGALANSLSLLGPQTAQQPAEEVPEEARNNPASRTLQHPREEGGEEMHFEGGGQEEEEGEEQWQRVWRQEQEHWEQLQALEQEMHSRGGPHEGGMLGEPVDMSRQQPILEQVQRQGPAQQPRAEPAGPEQTQGWARQPGEWGEGPAGDQEQEHPAGKQEQEPPAGEQVQEPPAGDQEQEPPAGALGDAAAFSFEASPF